MKKMLLPLMMVIVLVLSACGNQSSNTATTDKASSTETGTSAPATTGTITYQSETGPVEVPANPQRVIALAGYAGNLIALGVPLVGVDSWTKADPNFAEQLKDVAEVSDDNLEKIIELKPDLIIAASDTKNIEKLKKLAPVVTYTYNKVDYLTQIEEIAKAVNQADKGAAWIADFKERAQKAGAEIKAKIGDDATVTVMEGDSKQLYVFGSAWGRGTEIIYQAMGLKMPEKVKEMTSKKGYYDLSLEVLPEYLGDYVFYSKDPSVDASFQDTDTYKNIPAVKNNRVFEVDARGFYFNDAASLDYQLDFITKSLLGKS
ncbi:iron complex transport system substrate-binding protein [Paenibacillus sp. SORGH_AS306]|uniref:iron-hydroxamate ABC transporter substrate-binding protein n=1 Tax=unclassified Paenibacillus TaxID=185978 RepID=UPI002786673B|nr:MULTISPECIES: iron-hydroxamate ABC transporter substrate-binding protein [unclassified Paenibacillus]MDQ1234772.1 iron complex transport system substrate-binding protein [Paenibacillus sp. SORGH_AS_0306]MDR6111819.1 iron complex transport system substrate-binding protein [Paenibacillus sp. SORGH_AS_0338]